MVPRFAALMSGVPPSPSFKLGLGCRMGSNSLYRHRSNSRFFISFGKVFLTSFRSYSASLHWLLHLGQCMELGMNGAAWPQSRHRITNDILVLLPLLYSYVVLGLITNAFQCILNACNEVIFLERTFCDQPLTIVCKLFLLLVGQAAAADDQHWNISKGEVIA